jgi:hypothetical protein
MLSVRGVYKNGEIKIKEKVSITGESPVIVTFLKEVETEEAKEFEKEDIIDKLQANPLTIKNFSPFSREEIYGR